MTYIENKKIADIISVNTQTTACSVNLMVTNHPHLQSILSWIFFSVPWFR